MQEINEIFPGIYILYTLMFIVYYYCYLIVGTNCCYLPFRFNCLLILITIKIIIIIILGPFTFGHQDDENERENYEIEDILSPFRSDSMKKVYIIYYQAFANVSLDCDYD